MLASFLTAFVLVGLAELGDKSQLMLLGFSARYRPRKVIAGAAVSIVLLQAVAVGAGGVVGMCVPRHWIAPVVGVLFIAFGIASIKSRPERPEEEPPVRPDRFGPVITVAAALLLAELGDKTQLMTMSIAADPAAALGALGAVFAGLEPPEAGSLSARLGVWLGSTAGFLAADALAIMVGAALGRALPRRAISIFAGAVFIVFGVITLVSVFVA